MLFLNLPPPNLFNRQVQLGPAKDITTSSQNPAQSRPTIGSTF